MADVRMYQRRTFLEVLTTGVLAFVAGGALLLVSQQLHPYPIVSAVVRDVGSLLFATVMVSLLWELSGKRAFLDEILAATNLRDRIESTGLTGLPVNWNDDIPWTSLIAQCTNMDIFVAYAPNWRGAHQDELIRFIERGNTTCRVILPDPVLLPVVQAIGAQFDRDPDVVRERIMTAASDFRRLFSDRGAEGRLQIWYHSRPPMFAYYFFGDTAVVTMYKHNPNKPDIMGFIIRRGGRYFQFLEGERDGSLSTSRLEEV